MFCQSFSYANGKASLKVDLEKKTAGKEKRLDRCTIVNFNTDMCKLVYILGYLNLKWDKGLERNNFKAEGKMCGTFFVLCRNKEENWPKS